MDWRGFAKFRKEMSDVLPRQTFLSRKKVEQAARNNELIDYMTKNIHKDDWNTIICNKTDNSLLHFAAYFNDLYALKKLIQNGPNVNMLNKAGQTPTGLALIKQNYDCLELLVSRNGTITEIDVKNAVENEFAYGDDSFLNECLQILMENGYYRQVLANLKDSTDLIDTFICHIQSFRSKCKKVVITLLGIKKRRPEFWKTFDRFLIREIGLAIWSTRGDPDWEPDSEISRQHFDIYRYEDIHGDSLSESDVLGAAQDGRLYDLMKSRVLQKDWDRNITRDKWRFIHYAIDHFDVNAVAALISNGCDINSITAGGYTPKSLALEGVFYDGLAYLISAGVVISKIDLDDLLEYEADLNGPVDDYVDDMCERDQCMELLLQNGLVVGPNYRGRNGELLDKATSIFEQYRKACQTIIVTILGLKKRNYVSFGRIPIDLVLQLCVEIWITRADEHWLLPQKKRNTVTVANKA